MVRYSTNLIAPPYNYGVFGNTVCQTPTIGPNMREGVAGEYIDRRTTETEWI